MSEIITDLKTTLTLEQLEKDVFRGGNLKIGLPRIYGGQVLAQSLLAAAATTDSDRLPHSIHGYFLQIGDPKIPIVYSVEAIRDGGYFSTRRVVATQGERTIFNMSASFHREEDGYDHQIDPPNHYPLPDELISSIELLRSEFPDGNAFRDGDLARFPLDMKPVDHLGYRKAAAGEAATATWIRVPSEIDPLQLHHRAGLLFASDMALLSTAMRPHSRPLMHHKMMSASLDHAMWFHRDVDLSQWHLYCLDAPSAQKARGFTRGLLYDANGVLVASTAQEGLMRPTDL